MEEPTKAKAQRSERIWNVQRLSTSLGGEEASQQGEVKQASQGYC